MVERGERNPSDKMLASIADATGVSVEWLQEGDVPKESDTDDAERIDVSLFLNLVLHEAPEITTQILSAILAIDEKSWMPFYAKPIPTTPLGILGVLL